MPVRGFCGQDSPGGRGPFTARTERIRLLSPPLVATCLMKEINFNAVHVYVTLFSKANAQLPVIEHTGPGCDVQKVTVVNNTVWVSEHR